jgi:hypothetical protein
MNRMKHTYWLSHAYNYLHIHTYIQTYKLHIHTFKRALTYTHTHTHTYTYTHILIYITNMHSIDHMAFGYEKVTILKKHDYIQQSLVLYQKEKRKMYNQNNKIFIIPFL